MTLYLPARFATQFRQVLLHSGNQAQRLQRHRAESSHQPSGFDDGPLQPIVPQGEVALCQGGIVLPQGVTRLQMLLCTDQQLGNTVVELVSRLAAFLVVLLARRDIDHRG